MALSESPPLIPPPEGGSISQESKNITEPGGGRLFGGGNPHRPDSQDIKGLTIVARLERATASSILKSVKPCLLFLIFFKRGYSRGPNQMEAGARAWPSGVRRVPGAIGGKWYATGTLRAGVLKC